MASTYAQRKALGDYGERMAARHLVAQGYDILDRNWRCAEGELDIVAGCGDLVIVCEVKTRSGDAYGSPVEAVTPQKAARLFRLAVRWAQAHDCAHASLRVDVIAVRRPQSGPAELEHLVAVA